MTDILGYDVNGRPLRAGDKVVLFRTHNPFEFGREVGRVFTITGLSEVFPGNFYCCETLSSGRAPGTYSLRPASIRRLDDHQPSKYTFDELLDTLKIGAPDNANA